MRNGMKKCIAMLLCLAMIFSLLPAISVKAADPEIKLKFSADDLDKVDISYQIGETSPVSLDRNQADAGRAIWVNNIANGSGVKITVNPKENLEINNIRALEGEAENAGPAYDGIWDSTTNTYSFTASFNNGDSRIYVVSIETNDTSNPGNNPGNGGASWEDQYTQYLAPGINILSQWIGNSEGDISYSFSADNSSYTTPVTLDRSMVESCLSNVTNANKSTLFGISTGGNRYVKIKTGRDLGGNHLGFEIYAKDNQGNLQRDDAALSLLKYWSYHDKGWKDFSDATNREWEDYLKNSEAYDPDVQQNVPIDGLILDISNLDMNTYAIRCLLPFDSRKNVSWWNAKYKGEVAAAGDQVSDDSWVENGTVELVKVTSEDGSQVYYSNEPGWTADPNLDANMVVKIAKAGYDMGNDLLRPGYDGPHGEYTAEQMLEAAEKASGQCNIPVNAIATVMLTPDPGYQILAASLNGMPLTPDAGTQSKFSFQITSNIHFQALFEEAADVVDVGDAQEVTSATIGGTADVVDSGNLALTVKDDTGYDDTKALAVVDGEAVASLNIEVDQIIAKAGNLSEEEQAQAKEGKLEVTEEKFWKNNLTDLNNPVDIELVLDDITLEDNEELALVRDHNGECQEIPLDVNDQGGQTVATFASEKFSTYILIKKDAKKSDNTQNEVFATYEGNKFIKDKDGKIRCMNEDGKAVIDEFKCDGTYTYYFQYDGSAMTNRLTYHPDGKHVIYFDENGHEVFSNFIHVKKSIEGKEVDDYCFFDVYGFLYVDVVTYDKTGTVLYYANPYGVLERGKWFQFSETVKCADGTAWNGAAGNYGYANEDGTLMVNTVTFDWLGRMCYMQGNGVAKY